MPQRIKFTTPIAFTYRGVLIDRIQSIDLEAREVTASVTLLPADGSRKRSEVVTFQVPQAALDTFVGVCLNRIAARMLRLDGTNYNLAGSVEDVPEGTPIS